MSSRKAKPEARVAQVAASWENPDGGWQHFLPRFLLRGFADLNKRVWAFDKGAETVRHRPIKNVAAAPGYYDFRTEDGQVISLDPAMGRIESVGGKVVAKIREAGHLRTLTDEDVDFLALLTAVQFQRTEPRRKLIADMSEKMTARGREITAQLARAHGIDPPDLQPLEGRSLQETFLDGIAQARELVSVVRQKQLLLFRAPSGTEFCIGDGGVALQNTVPAPTPLHGNLGFASRGIEIYLPISSSLCIAWYCPTLLDAVEKWASLNPEFRAFLAHKPEFQRRVPTLDALANALEGNVMLCSPENVVRFNSLQVRFAETEVYSQHNDFALARSMVQEHAEFRHGPRAKVS